MTPHPTDPHAGLREIAERVDARISIDEAWIDAGVAVSEDDRQHLADLRALLDQIARLTAERDEAQAEIARRDAVLNERWGDEADEHTPAIVAAHPTRTKDHDTYMLALKMVGKRHSKYALVDLVNWLLVRANPDQESGR